MSHGTPPTAPQGGLMAPHLVEKVPAIQTKQRVHQEHQMAQMWFKLAMMTWTSNWCTKEPGGASQGLNSWEWVCSVSWLFEPVVSMLAKSGIQNYYKCHKGQCPMCYKEEEEEYWRYYWKKTKANGLGQSNSHMKLKGDLLSWNFSTTLDVVQLEYSIHGVDLQCIWGQAGGKRTSQWPSRVAPS